MFVCFAFELLTYSSFMKRTHVQAAMHIQYIGHICQLCHTLILNIQVVLNTRMCQWLQYYNVRHFVVTLAWLRVSLQNDYKCRISRSRVFQPEADATIS